MKKLFTVLILLAAGGSAAYYYYVYAKPQEKPQIVQATISQGDIREIVRTTGTLEPLRTVPVGSQVSGVVQELYADFNDVVKAGQVIAKIDPTLLNVQVQIQEANVARQEGEINSQGVQLEQSKVDLKRTQELFDKGLANQQQLDQANLTLKTRTTSLDSAQKQLLTNKANLDQAKLNVSYTVITSPIDGVVINRQVDRGQTVQSSMNVAQFFTLATELQQLKLTAGVDEAEIGKIKPGMTVSFVVDAYQGQTFYGSVENVRLNAQTQNNVVTYPVWINAPNPDLKLRPSMTASITIEISSAQGATRIPNQALRFRPTTDMYTALGLTPPAAGQGRALNAGANGQAGDTAAGANGGGRGRGNRRQGGDAAAAGDAAAGAPAAGAPPAAGAAPGRGAQGAPAVQGQGGNRQPGGGQGANAGGGRGGQAAGAQPGGRGGQPGGAQGFGGGTRGNFANMTPEERQRMMAQFGGAAGGRGGNGGRGGRGAQQQGPPAPTAGALPAGTKIDSLFAGVPKRITNGNVWMWDEANKKLTEVRVSTGITDGQFSELITGEIKVGQQVVTSIILPVKAAAGGNSNLFGGQQGGRGGGLQPGGAGGAGGGGFGGGGPGGGGGGFGGGGGGGGRGGGN